jgi:hypothetical protein
MATDEANIRPRKSAWRWITPDLLVVVLLVAEILLFLSEQYQWFPLNQHKGWTVLVAVAAVGVTFLVMLACLVAGLLFKWRFQFSLRSLLLWMAAVAMTCGWLTGEMRAAERQQETVQAIKVLQAGVGYDYQRGGIESAESDDGNPYHSPLRPEWLRNLVGRDFVATVTTVSFGSLSVTDEDMHHVQGLTHLSKLDLAGTAVTDAGLANLKGMTHLEELWLGKTGVTDAGLECLETMR